MPDSDNLGSFISENKKLAKEYLETKIDITRLRLIRIVSKLSGYFIWVIVSLFLLSLLITFIGLTLGFWLSQLTGSYAKGFGLTSIFIFLVILLIMALRKVLFVNPIIRGIIKNTNEDDMHHENQAS
jgi:beta-lactamase regulating signal transducer with metallopeptidase domain